MRRACACASRARDGLMPRVSAWSRIERGTRGNREYRPSEFEFGLAYVVRTPVASGCWDSGIILWGTGYTLTIVQWARFCVFDLTMRPWCCAAIVASSASASPFLDIFVPRMIIILYPRVLLQAQRAKEHFLDFGLLHVCPCRREHERLQITPLPLASTGLYIRPFAIDVGQRAYILSCMQIGHSRNTTKQPLSGRRLEDKLTIFVPAMKVSCRWHTHAVASGLAPLLAF